MKGSTLRLICLYILLYFLAGCREQTKRSYKIIRYNQGDEGLTSLDPAFARSKGNIRAVSQLYNGLTELDNNLNVQSSVADHWDVSENGLVYTFHLRDSVFFHADDAFGNAGRRAVTAHDFVYSFKRLMDSSTASPGAWIFNDKVLRNARGRISDTCFVAADAKTLRIHLQQPFPAFLEILAMPYAFVVPEEAVKKYGKDFRIHPVGTGPFQFKLWEEGTTLIFHKNAAYWKTDSSGQRLPYLDAVQVSFITDKTLAFLTFSQGKLDFLFGIEDNAPELFLEQDGHLKEEFYHRFRFRKDPYLYTEYLGFQLDTAFYKDKKHPFLNKKVRQALNYAINREELIAYIRFNVGEAGTHGIVPLALPYFAEHPVKGYDYDPQKSLRLLKEAGYNHPGDLPELKLYTSAPYRYIAEHLQKQWDNAGIKVTLEINQNSTHREMTEKGIAHLFKASWLGDYPDAENYLSLFYSKNFTPNGPNKCHYRNAAYDALFEKAIRQTNVQQRNATYRELDEMMMEDSPVIVLFYEQNISISQMYVKGLQSNAMATIMLEKVDMEKRD